MQPDTPVDAEHEETYIVAYADTCAESQFLKEIIEFELRAWTSFIVVECPHVACIEEDGTIHIAAIEGPAGDAAKAMILGIVKEPEVGETFDGEVVGIKDFGAFVKLTPGKDGLLHISRVANGRVGKVEDVLNLGDIIKVEVLEVDPKTGKISLDRLDKPDAPESSASNGERRERGDRNGGRDNRPGRSGREGNGGGNRTPRRRHDA